MVVDRQRLIFMEKESDRQQEKETSRDGNRSYLGRLLKNYKKRARNAAFGIYLAAASLGPGLPAAEHIAYEKGPEIRQLEEQYIPDGVVAWTDAVSRINRHSDERMPYWATEFAMDHEKGHIECEKYGKPHDEAKLNREAMVRLNRQISPFPSYHDPYF